VLQPPTWVASILVAFYDMHGLQWDYSFPRSPHGESLSSTRTLSYKLHLAVHHWRVMLSFQILLERNLSMTGPERLGVLFWRLAFIQCADALRVIMFVTNTHSLSLSLSVPLKCSASILPACCIPLWDFRNHCTGLLLPPSLLLSMGVKLGPPH
jgi:hypothetical protein